MAGIIQRGNKWYAIYQINVGGRKKEKRAATGIEVEPSIIPKGMTKATAKKENEAKARLIASELEKQAKGGKVDENIIINAVGKQKAKEMLGDAILPGCEEFLNTWQSKRIVANPKNDIKAIKQFISWLGERKNIGIDLITKQDAIDFMNHEVERVKESTVGLYLQSLRTAFQTAVDARMFPYNPFTKVRPPSKQSQKRKAFTKEQVDELIKTLPGEWPDMIRVCLYTGGQRLGDIAQLRWEQIDLENGHLRMTAQKTKRAMNKPIINALKDVLERRYKDRSADFVFPYAKMRHSQCGGRASKLSIEFGNLLKEHGFTEGAKQGDGDRRILSDLSFHSLRATAVTALRSAGVSADLCRVIVGHDSEEIQRVYFRPDDDMIKDAMNSLDFEK